MDIIFNDIDCILEKSKDNKEVFRIQINDKWIYLGSKYNVSRDIDTFINKIREHHSIDLIKNIIVYGLGAGEHIARLLELFPDIHIHVVEPSEVVFKNFNKTRNYKFIVESNRFEYFYFNGSERNLLNFLSRFLNEFNLDTFIDVSFANYEVVYSTTYLDFLKILKEYIINLRINVNTNMKFTKIWFEAFIRNVINMANSTPIDAIKNSYLGKPAIIVSAGPSLEKNIHLLKEAQNNFIVITGGRTLKTLLDLDIKPDFVVVIDPVDKTHKLLEPVLSNESPLIFYEGTNPDVVEKYKGYKLFYVLNQFTKKMIDIEVSSLLSGGSVAITCMGLAIHLGCNPIIFIGQDLAYTDQKLHAENAKLKDENNLIEDPNSFFVDDIYGNKIKTSYSLNSFRKIIEYYISIYNDRVYINATEGGANINGTSIMTLSEVIYNYADKHLNKHLKLLNEEKLINQQKVTEKLRKVMLDFKEARKKCKEGIRLSYELYQIVLEGKLTSKKINSINEKLESIDKRLVEIFENGGFANYILYPITKEILSEQNFKITKNDCELDKAKKIVNKSKKLYSDILITLDEAIEIMKKYL